MGFDHIGLKTADVDKLSAFYLKALAPLGYRKIMQPMPHVVGLGTCGPSFWLAGPCPEQQAALEKVASESEDTKTSSWPVSTPIHVAFSTRSRAAVRAFHKAALEAGAKCNGPPGFRPEYFSLYYAAYVTDPEGRNIEAVCMLPGIWSEDGPFWSLISGVAVAVAAGATKWWGIW
ncbi:Glyoxalase/Bleomycin resistance protein/Dihydroxybiphenyl dioxygenase [Pluteus cervinus]|uniref:Glyoxalase/Bleomycin resistance protein/Dihydroxybiphenyl dioxygenase n=1 Tax=Pluteus cervinus TaxID=181527 RepID=A0ACD3B792_9AGAR|nr:Glyoxalase/Bleomycin resistance protein/Dihydroxybiphenyl dioxygenase [Pluteus cervinus]